MRVRFLVSLAALATMVALVVSAEQSPAAPDTPFDTPPGTFSILAFDPETQEIGAAVMSKVFSVGNGVIWAEAGVGAVATQATVDVSYGPKGLDLLRQGMSPADIVKKLLADDPDAGSNGRPWPKTGRQFAVMNAKGESVAHTGTTAQAWAGHKQGKYCTAQGNILASEDVVTRMIEGFEKSELDETGRRRHISLRLVTALEGGKSAGGDKRTSTSPHSAALIVVKKDAGPWLHNDVVLRLQVDEHADPIVELRRLVEMSPPARRGRGRGGR